MPRLPILVAAALAELRRLPASGAFRWLATATLTIAAAFVALHLAMAYIIPDSGFDAWHKTNMERDRGYSERYEYILMALTALALGVEWLRRRASIYLAAAAVFTFMILDNMWEVHEMTGLALHSAGLVSWNHYGELIYFAVAGAMIVAAIAASLRANDGADCARALAVLAMILPTAGFGVAVDLVHALLEHDPLWNDVFRLIEESGELAMICITAAVALALAAQRGERDAVAPGLARLRVSPVSLAEPGRDR